MEILKEDIVLRLEKKLTVKLIAEELKTTPRAIYYYLDKYKIDLKKYKIKSRTAWNKGLTKDDPRVEKSTRLALEARKNSGKEVWNKGLKLKPHSDETKRKIGNALKREPLFSKEKLQELIDQNLSTEEMGKELGYDGSSVRNWLRNLGLQTNVRKRGFQGIHEGHKNFLDPEIRKKAVENGREATKRRNLKKYGKESYCESKICIHCESPFDVKKPWLFDNQQFCSQKCSYAYRSNFRGDKHFNYKGGVHRGEQTMRNWAVYKQFKKEVHTRDGGKCTLCQERRKLDVHHLEPWYLNEEKRFDVNNGISLCRECHREIHKRCTQKNYTFEKFQENYTMVNGMCFENII